MRMTTNTPTNNTPPAPSAPPDINDLPHPLTIFVSRRDRKRIIAALRRIDADRGNALMKALGISCGDAQ